MDPKPFTYEHFIQAVQSQKDDMLMYYIDEAVAIYCRIKVILSDFKALHFRVESSDHDPLVNVKEMSREASLIVTPFLMKNPPELLFLGNLGGTICDLFLRSSMPYYVGRLNSVALHRRIRAIRFYS